MSSDVTASSSLAANFLGHSPRWYKLTIVGFLLADPVLFALDGSLAGGALVLEFIFTLALALALRCYPLAPGGLLAIEAVVIDMTAPAAVFSSDRIVMRHNFLYIRRRCLLREAESTAPVAWFS